jgi:hypothetical protein
MKFLLSFPRPLIYSHRCDDADFHQLHEMIIANAANPSKLSLLEKDRGTDVSLRLLQGQFEQVILHSSPSIYVSMILHRQHVILILFCTFCFFSFSCLLASDEERKPVDFQGQSRHCSQERVSSYVSLIRILLSTKLNTLLL